MKNQVNVVTKKGSHCGEMLSAIPTAFSSAQGGDPRVLRTAKSGMTTKDCFAYARNDGRKGFTLIELLVVVLIIGILAAVAVPQYQKAVEKSRATEAITLLKNIRDQQVLCFLEKGKVSDCGAGGDHTSLMEWAHIEIPSSQWDDDCWFASCEVSTHDFSYATDGSGLGLNIYAVRLPFATKYALITTADDEADPKIYNQIGCYNWDEDRNWCQLLGLSEVDLFL